MSHVGGGGVVGKPSWWMFRSCGLRGALINVRPIFFFLHIHYSYAVPAGDPDEPPGSPGGFKGCRVNLAGPRSE